MHEPTVVVAGATGNLGGRIVEKLLQLGVSVRALVRQGASEDRVAKLRQLGATVVAVNYADARQLEQACAGACCVVSALQGLRDVIVDVQGGLLEAALKAGVPRFIPSDYSIDFTRLPPGRNRNLDLRRQFHERLCGSRIRATTVFNGAFMELLAGPMPLLLPKRRLVLYWGSADQRLDFTTVNDTAAFTARAALDAQAPRFLRIAGDQLSARELAQVASEVSGRRFRLLRAGTLRSLDVFIRLARLVAPGEKEVYPLWQCMQYMRDMFDGRAKLEPLDNDRYPGMRWTKVRNFLAGRL